MEESLFKTGQAFRETLLHRKIPPHQYSALLQDIAQGKDNLLPALIDLSRRQLFHELPLTGSDAQKNLSKDQLLAELGPLYRSEIMDNLGHFIEGVLDMAANNHNDLKMMTNDERQASHSKASVLDILPTRFDPRIPMGRKSYFLTSLVTGLTVFIVWMVFFFLIVFLLAFLLGDATPDYLTEESVPYPYWMGVFIIPSLIPIHLLDFRRAKAASIHNAWVYLLITLSIIDCFYSLNRSDFFSPIARIQGFFYLFFLFKKNRVQVPWPRE